MPAFRPPAVRQRPMSLFGFAFSVLALGACEPSSSNGGSGGSGNASGGRPGSGGNTGSGGSAGSGGSPASGGSSATGGSSASGGSKGSGGAGSGGSATGGGIGTGGGGSGSGGAAAGGAGTGGAAAGTGGGAGGGGGPAGTGGASGGGACPANATFCSGFEQAGLPPGAVFKLNGDPATPFTSYFEIDTTVHNSGKSSLRVKTISESGGAYKMLSVPAPGAAFWVRFHLRSDVDLGANDHNVYAYAAGSDDPNDSMNVEFAEDVGMAFNAHDDVRWPAGYGRVAGGAMKPFTLAKDTWHCIEISFDGQGRVQMLYMNGTQQINATSFPTQAAAFKVFKFGYNALHGTIRKTWYDDLVVAPTRTPCP